MTNDIYLRKYSSIIIEYPDKSREEVTGINNLNLKDVSSINTYRPILHWMLDLKTELPDPTLENDLHKLIVEDSNGGKTILIFKTLKKAYRAYILLKDKYNV